MNGLILVIALTGQVAPDWVVPHEPPMPLAEAEIVHGAAIYSTPKGVKYQLNHTATVDSAKGTVVITATTATLVVEPPPIPVPVPPVPPKPVPTPTPPCPPCPPPSPPAPVVYVYPQEFSGGCYQNCGHRGFRPGRFLLNVAFWPVWLLGGGCR